MRRERVLILEDDAFQAEEIKKCLRPLGLEVDFKMTESEFRKMVNSGGVSGYAVAVVDLMLRWTDPAPNMERPPQDVVEGGSYLAGLRSCAQLRVHGIPCVIFTALDPSKIPVSDIPVINKSQGCDALIREINRLIRQ